MSFTVLRSKRHHMSSDKDSIESNLPPSNTSRKSRYQTAVGIGDIPCTRGVLKKKVETNNKRKSNKIETKRSVRSLVTNELIELSQRRIREATLTLNDLKAEEETNEELVRISSYSEVFEDEFIASVLFDEDKEQSKRHLS